MSKSRSGNGNHRSFPFISVLTTVLLCFAVFYECYLDIDTSARSFHHIASVFSQFRDNMHLFTQSLAESGFTIIDRQSSNDPTSVSKPEIPLLVNLSHPLPDDYVPQDLVNMRQYCNPAIVSIKGSDIQGNKAAVDALLNMFTAAISEGQSDWQISAGYRSIQYQQQLFNDTVYKYRQDGLSSSQARNATSRYVAAPGSSEHHTGLAFDITIPGQSFALTPQCKWLHANCWRFGFIIRYTEEKESITGIAAEAWHIRYVGQPHAQVIHENNWCLEEYITYLENLGIYQ